MHSFNPQRLRSWSRVGLAVSGMTFSAVLLTGCSSVPNAVNPVHWYDSVASWISPDDDAGTTADAGSQDDGKTAAPSGLSADRTNAHYSSAEAAREGTPTRALSPEAAVVHDAPAVPAAPAVQTSDAAPPPVAPVVRSSDTVPVSHSNDTAPQTAATSTATQGYRAPPAGGETVEQVYRRRLSEFDKLPVLQPGVTFQPSRQTYSHGPATASAQTPTPYVSDSGQAARLNRSDLDRSSRGGSGVRSLADFDGSHGSSSFDLASISFGEGTSKLSSSDRAQLRDVAVLCRQKDGRIRIIANSASQRLDVDPRSNLEANRALARMRADAIAAELVRLGVPARRIYAGAADDLAQNSVADGAEILLDL